MTDSEPASSLGVHGILGVSFFALRVLRQNAAEMQNGTNGSIAQQIRTNLEKAGFKNIKLMPSSFLVRATDQDNNPVMMVINPDSITEVTATQTNGTNTPSGGTTNSQSH